MTTMTLRISTRNYQDHVHYKNPIVIKINEHNNSNNNDINFPKTNIEEVKKKNHILLKTIYLTSVSIFGLTTPILAQTEQLIPKNELMEIIGYITGITALSGVGIAVILLQAAGVYRMFPKKKKDATDWSVDIVKGLTQIAVAPIVIGTIATLAYLLFGNSVWFVSLF